MTRSTDSFTSSEPDLRNLQEEHSEVIRLYTELDEAILEALGSPRILGAAGSLIKMMLLHIKHEQPYLDRITSPILEDQRESLQNILPELKKIEEGMTEQEVYVALRLRGLCKKWICDHLHLRQIELERPAMPGLLETGGMYQQSQVN